MISQINKFYQIVFNAITDIDYGLVFISFVLLILSIGLFMWYNNGKDAPLRSLSKKIKFVTALLLFILFVLFFNWSFGNTDVLLPLFNDCVSAFIGFSVAIAFKNRLL